MVPSSQLSSMRWTSIGVGTGGTCVTVTLSEPERTVAVLGIVENMAVHICSNCGHAEHIFGAGGGERMAAQYGVQLLGSLPLDIGIREQADSGTPSVVSQPDSAIAATYREIARKVAGKLSMQARNKSIAFPNIVIQNT